MKNMSKKHGIHGGRRMMSTQFSVILLQRVG